MAPRIDYFFKETAQSLKRNGLVTFATVSTVFIALFLLGGALLVRYQSNLIIERATENVEISVYLADTISPSQRQHLQTMLQDMPEVAEVRYESKAQAWERFQEIFREQNELVENTSPDAIPASFRVKLGDTEQYAVVKARLTGQPGIETIVDHAEFLKRLNSVTAALRVGVLWLAFLMLATSAVLIGNTVRMAVAARSKEIGIMRLVGATNWFIRIPFLIEGMLQGLIGAGAAVLGLLVMKGAFIDSLRQDIQFVDWIQTSDIIPIIPFTLLIGVALSVVASLVAMRRPLEV